MKETIRIELTQYQHQKLKEIGLSNSEIKSYGCTHPSSGVTIDHYMTVGVKKPITDGAEWNGEGFPPVGARCEFVRNPRQEEPDFVLIKYVSRDYIIIEYIDSGNEDCISTSVTHTLSPIETEAERNERERLEGIDAMYMAISDYSGSPVRNSDTWRDCEALYSAGYRKAVTNE